MPESEIQNISSPAKLTEAADILAVAERGDVSLDELLQQAVSPWVGVVNGVAPPYTTSLDAISALAGQLAPARWPEILRTALSALAQRHDWHMCLAEAEQIGELALAVSATLAVELARRPPPLPDTPPSPAPHIDAEDGNVRCSVPRKSVLVLCVVAIIASMWGLGPADSGIVSVQDAPKTTFYIRGGASLDVGEGGVTASPPLAVVYGKDACPAETGLRATLFFGDGMPRHDCIRADGKEVEVWFALSGNGGVEHEIWTLHADGNLTRPDGRIIFRPGVRSTHTRMVL